jgi:MFS family permease
MTNRQVAGVATAVPESTGPPPPIARITALLAASLAAHTAMLQLVAAVASITLVQVLDVDGMLGLGPAITLATGALVAVPAGRLMDRVGRVPVLVAGFGVGAAGCGLAAVGSAHGSAPAVLAGLVGVGTATGAGLLIRVAAGDLYPPERRARGTALVLFGAVFGAILGPAVFSPLLAGRALHGEALAALWLAAGGFELASLALAAAVRPDPKTVATLTRPQPTRVTARTVGIAELLRRPGVVPAVLAAQASVGVMVGVMTLTGAMVVGHLHHQAHSVFPIMGVHVIGMYAFVIVVGGLVDRIGRTPSLAGGLLVMGVSVAGLLWARSVPATAVALFGLGAGWNISFVAATAELADRTEPSERGRLLGWNDLLSGATGAGLTLLGGLVLTTAGMPALAIGAAALVVLPALWILRDGAAPTRRRPTTTLRRSA